MLATGRAVGEKIAAGKTRIVTDAKSLAAFQPGEVLVAELTSPDWEPVMKTAAGIVTERGGRTCCPPALEYFGKVVAPTVATWAKCSGFHHADGIIPGQGKIGERRLREHLRAILGENAIAHLTTAELALHHTKEASTFALCRTFVRKHQVLLTRQPHENEQRPG